jgi:4-amino-4-deoxy-L-arabinose transferase-like glycosyltransferase
MRLVTRDARRDAWWLFGIALLLLAAGLGLREPWPADEPRFALVARQMVESGHWLFPMRGDELYPDKPPLFMWLQALSYLVVRSWRVAFLLPSLFAALGTLWLVQDLGTRLWNRRVGLYAAYALLFTLQFTFLAKRAQIDATVTFFITLAMYGLLRHLLRGPDWKWLCLGFFAAGVGVITKGVGLVALLVFVPALFARGRVQRVGARGAAAGMACFLGAIALWAVPMAWFAFTGGDPAGREYAENILLRQTAQRYANAWHHHQPFWYFAQVIATLWLPVALALPWAVPAWWRRVRRGDARQLLLLGWVAMVLLFFTIPSGKRDVYILPALPMFCLALAPLLPGLLRRRGVRLALLAFVALFAVGGLAAGTAALLGEPGFEARVEAGRGIDAESDALWWIVVAIGAVAAVALAAGRLRHALAAALATLAATWLLIGWLAYPQLDDSSSARALMQEVGRRIGTDGELALVAWKEQNLLQADRPARTFGFRRDDADELRDAIAWQREAPSRRWVMVLDTAMGACIDRARAIDAGASNRRRWWLFRADAVIDGCTPAAGDSSRE